jgi:phosphate:Na+ symporter
MTTLAKIDPVGIAVCHTVFNILNTAALIPFVNWLEKLANLVVRGDDKDAMPEVFLDERLFTVPAVAAAKAYDITGEMALTTKDTVAMAFGLFDRYDEVIASEVTRKEKTLDMYEDKLGSYLVSLSRCDLNENDARTSAMLLHTISDFERIGDHANNLVHTAAEMREKKLAFSEDAAAELRVLTDAVQTILAESITAFTENDMELASEIEPLEQVIDDLIDTIRARHITRLQSGNCTIELGFILTDFLTDCERISDHCSNVGVAILETAHGTFDTHERLRAIKSRANENFRQSFEKYQRQFVLQA